MKSPKERFDKFLNGLFDRKLGGQSKDRLTAELILENLDKFHPNAVKWARVLTNVADFLRAQTLDKGQPALANTDVHFQITQSRNEPISQMSFLAGGVCDFTYTDDQDYRTKPLNGKLSVGIKRGYLGSFYRTDHPEVGLEFSELEYFAHYIDGNWELVIGKGHELFDDRDGHEYTVKDFNNLCLAIASPFKAFLEDFGVPAWNRPGHPESTPKLS
jgi:hypothetical protein